jgi:hypothetical protein
VKMQQSTGAKGTVSTLIYRYALIRTQPKLVSTLKKLLSTHKEMAWTRIGTSRTWMGYKSLILRSCLSLGLEIERGVSCPYGR